MVFFKKAAAAKQTPDDPGVGASSPRTFGPHHRLSSTDTVIYHPQNRQENVRPTLGSTLRRANTNQSGGPRTVTVYSGIPQCIGFPTRDTSATDFDTSITQEPNWQLPDSITQVLRFQAKRYAEPKPKEGSFAQQTLTRNRVFDPEAGTIYSHCNECDPTGGPTDCQHPEDPKQYSTRLNPIRKDDPGFAHLNQPLPVPTTPKKPSPADKLISKASPSKATVTQEGKLRLTFSSPDGVDKAVQHLDRFSYLGRGKKKQAKQPDEMLAARHLSNFLTDNVEEGVATSYIVFSTHGTLFGYSSPLEVKTARNIAALAGVTWRANDQALLRGGPVKPLTSGATLLKTVSVTKAEKGPGLFNMIYIYNDLLMAVQWIKGGFLVAAMIEATETDHIYDEPDKPAGGLQMGAGAKHDTDSVWEDEEAVEETSEDEEDRVKARKDPTKQAKLFEKSQAMAEAMREQWKHDDFKMPRGFR